MEVDMAVIVGTAIGGVSTLMAEYDTLLAKGPARVSPFLMPMMLSDMTSGQLSIRLGAKGVNYALVSACASGADSIGEAANIIRRGDAEIALAGGTEAAITPICMAGFAAAKALTSRNDDPARASRPFDLTRDGFVMGEGAGLIVIESEEHALARGAKIYGEVTGYGATSDGYDMVAPSGEGGERSMRLALSTLPKGRKVDYINSHGTSTVVGDVTEVEAIRRVFGKGSTPPIASTKSLTGHSLGATGVHEAIYSLLMMNGDFIAASANVTTLDPALDPSEIVTTLREGVKLDSVLSNSFGFGGTNATLVMSKLLG